MPRPVCRHHDAESRPSNSLDRCSRNSPSTRNGSFGLFTSAFCHLSFSQITTPPLNPTQPNPTDPVYPKKKNKKKGSQNLLLPSNNLHPLQQHPRDLAVDVLPHGRAVGRGLGRHGEACCA